MSDCGTTLSALSTVALRHIFLFCVKELRDILLVFSQINYIVWPRGSAGAKISEPLKVTEIELNQEN